MNSKIKPIAIYLPQFHPIPENDWWWGKGFTEWNNVVKAKPRFENHYQPHLPADLGFYDLRLHEIREQQVQLAKDNGIYGFCYYHYWFNGKRVLDRPFEEVFESKKPDFPFCLCWANENWTRAWDGSERDILLEQSYSEQDDKEHINYLIKYFKDDRYIKVNGKPVFIFYKPDLFPNMKRTIEVFREEALKHGIELYLCRFERWIDSKPYNDEEIGFDAAIEFQPLSPSLKEFVKHLERKAHQEYCNKSIVEKCIIKIDKKIENVFGKQDNTVKDDIFDYSEFVEFDLKRKQPKYKIYPGVSPMWDNTSRRENQRAIIFKNSTPTIFEKWFSKKIEKFKPFSEEENFIFINAWNEWAEGNHLEPCKKWGLQYLEAIKRTLKGND
ncbi:glycoside hydrolase family 99-like domain-containing protein [Mangrovimonas xylaniphaga]|uniref:glycoside hydrolase family 99-like domain-containing protein n=1 Tax=Mangrovimonas xylaniphaga TaxID=1645915 RepID=UPI0006B5D535|nr:glycoside hydrolase family 99-like domain-containing protein [Mangrovimonas xylaniphaga]